MNKVSAKKYPVDFLSGLFLSFASLLAYLPSFSGSFHMDDYPSIVESAYIQIDGLNAGSLFRASFQDFRQNRPFPNLTFALNYYFNDLNPFGYHLVNFFTHIFAGIGIWLILRAFFLHLGFDGFRARLASFLSTLVWSLEPVHTQAISYIVQRYILIAGAFYIWAIYFYHLGLKSERKRALFFFLSGLCSVLAMLSKEIALTIPFMLFAYRIYFFDKLKKGWLRRNMKWIIALLLFYASVISVAMRPRMLGVIFNFSGLNYGWQERLFSQPRVLLWNIFIISFPYPQFLSVLHKFQLSESFFQPLSTFLCFITIILVLIFVLVRSRRNPIFCFAIIWYFGVLFIESLPLPIHMIFEHRLYIASLSIIVPLISYPILKLKRVALSVVLVFILAFLFGTMTYKRNLIWRDDISLWKDTVKKAPSSLNPWLRLCDSLSIARECDKAERVCQIAGANKISYQIAHNSLGVCYLKTGRVELAKKEFLSTLNKGYRVAGSVCLNLGIIYSLEKDYENAVKWYLKAISKEPNNIKAHYNLAQTYYQLNNIDGFIAEMLKVLELSPGARRVRLRLALEYVNKNECGKAIQLLKQAPEEFPEFSKVYELCK